MIAALIVGLTLAASSAVGVSEPLTAEAACALSRTYEIFGGKSYSIRGQYISDWEYGSLVELPACDGSLDAFMDGGAAAKVAEYHQAYAKQCGQDFVNDYVSGVFTGAFIRRKKEFSGKTYMADFFVITGVQTRDLNISAITCPKK